MEALRKSLKDYFVYLEKHCNIVNNLVPKVLKPVESVKNFSEQLSYVKRAEIEDMPIGKIPHIKENLIFKMQQSLGEEISAIQQIVEELQTANSGLEKRLQNVLRCLENIGDLTALEDQQTICFGSADCPSILQLIEWAQDSWRLYHALYVKLCNYVMEIESGEEEKITVMNKHYLESEELKVILERALASTHTFRGGT